MIYLLLSVVASTLVFVIFKLFARYKVNNLKAIIVNYFTAHLIGAAIAGGYSPTQLTEANWIGVALGLGLLFISLFNVMAITSQKNGVAVASVANKMSLVIPVSIAILYFGESYNWIKITGILLTCLGVWLTSASDKNTSSEKSWLLPLILFLGSGVLDSVLNHASKTMVENDSDLFSATIFLCAGLFGFLFLLIKRDLKWTANDILWGVILGSVNYFSIFLLLEALESSHWESSVVFPVNNMSIVAVSTLVSAFFFHEKLALKNKIGIAIAIFSILIITWS